MPKFFTLSLLICMSFSLKAKESSFIPYVIKKGDSVSQILVNYSKTPLYGKNKWVHRVLKMNRLSWQTAKKLEPGDVIVLPVQAKVFVKNSYVDEVKSLQSSWQKSLKTNYLAPKENNITVLASYFNRNYDLNSQQVRINQGLMVNIEYKHKDLDNSNRFRYNPTFSFQTYTQNNANFSDNDSLVAEFTPSFLSSFQYEFEDTQSQFSISPIVAYESFSLLQENDEEFDISVLDVSWIGLEVARYFHFDHNTYRLSANYLVGNNYNASRSQIKLRGFIDQHYIAEIFMTQSNFELVSDNSTFDSGVSVGYRF